MENITNAFGGKEQAEANPVWSQIMAIVEQGHAESVARAEELGNQLREAMTSAFEDGHLTPDEIGNIQSIMDEQNAMPTASSAASSPRVCALRKIRCLSA